MKEEVKSTEDTSVKKNKFKDALNSMSQREQRRLILAFIGGCVILFVINILKIILK